MPDLELPAWVTLLVAVVSAASAVIGTRWTARGQIDASAATGQAAVEVARLQADEAAEARGEAVLERRLLACEAEHRRTKAVMEWQSTMIRRQETRITLLKWHSDLMRSALIKLGADVPEPPPDLPGASEHLYPYPEEKFDKEA